MAETAFQKQYRQELIQGFERRESQLRQTCITEGNVRGNEIIFAVADSGGASATTRGVNGKIQARGPNTEQYTCPLVEWHDLATMTNYNILSSQGNQRAAMQDGTIAVMNRKIDDQIITELSTATLWAGTTAATMTLPLALRAIAILGANNVPIDNQLFGVITPAAHAYLMQLKEFASADYVSDRKFEGVRAQFRWANVQWLVHSALPGAGTNNETCFVYHRNAIGHGMHLSGLDIAVGYDEEQAYSFARASGHMGAKLLQNSGVVKIRHDGSAMVATA
jgi:hypothetical protein